MKYKIGDLVTVDYIPCPDDWDYDGIKLEDSWYGVADNDLCKTIGIIYKETEDKYIAYFLPKQDDFWDTAVTREILKKIPEEDGVPLSEIDAIIKGHLSINRLKKIS